MRQLTSQQCNRLNFPAEWLLDVFCDESKKAYHRPRPYVMSIELPRNYANEYALGALTCFLTLIGLLLYWLV
jgi:hypothetical protein